MAKKIKRNDLVDLVRDYKSGRFTNHPPMPSGGETRYPSWVIVKNTTATEIKTGERLKIDGFLYSADSLAEFLELHLINGVSLEGSAPTSDGSFLVTAIENIPSGALGRCMAPGAVVPSAINITKEYHTLSGHEGGYVKSLLAGPDRIIAKPSGTGPKWGYISLGTGWAAASYSGVLATALTAGTEKSATVTVTFTGTANTETVTAYTYPGLTVKAVAVGKAVRIVFDPLAQKWYFDKLDC